MKSFRRSHLFYSLVTPILPILGQVGWWRCKWSWKMDPSACSCLADVTGITLRRQIWKAGVSMEPWPKLSYHLLSRGLMHIQDPPARQDLTPGLPLAHPKIPAASREKSPLRILSFKTSYCNLSSAISWAGQSATKPVSFFPLATHFL